MRWQKNRKTTRQHVPSRKRLRRERRPHHDRRFSVSLVGDKTPHRHPYARAVRTSERFDYLPGKGHTANRYRRERIIRLAKNTNPRFLDIPDFNKRIHYHKKKVPMKEIIHIFAPVCYITVHSYISQLARL